MLSRVALLLLVVLHGARVRSFALTRPSPRGMGVSLYSGGGGDGSTGVPSKENHVIKVGDKLPLDVSVQMVHQEAEGTFKNKDILLADLCAGRKVVLFGVPGAFTPTGTNLHLPGFLELGEQFKEKGVDEIICVAVNDAFVLHAWAQATKAEGKVTFVADGAGRFTRAVGLEFDTGVWGGIRCRRMSMLVDDGVVKIANLEEKGKFTELSGAAFLLSQMD